MFVKSIQPVMSDSFGFFTFAFFFFIYIYIYIYIYIFRWRGEGLYYVCNRVVRHVGVITFPCVLGLI